MAKVTGEHPQVDSQWSHSELAAEMRAASIPISASRIGRILAADDVKPHRVQGWLTRTDTPEFWAQAADVCGLYLSPPANAVVLSVGGHEILPIGGHENARWWPTVLPTGGQWFCPC